jgi:hypothetical protein
MRPDSRGTVQYQDSKWSHLYEVQNHEDRFFIIGRVSLKFIPRFSRIGSSEAGFGLLGIYLTVLTRITNKIR